MHCEYISKFYVPSGLFSKFNHLHLVNSHDLMQPHASIQLSITYDHHHYFALSQHLTILLFLKHPYDKKGTVPVFRIS